MRRRGAQRRTVTTAGGYSASNSWAYPPLKSGSNGGGVRATTPFPTLLLLMRR